MKRNSVYLLMVVVLLVMYGCAKPAAEVNGEKISMKTYKMVLDEKIKQHSVQDADIGEDKLKNSVIQQLIGEKLLLQAAKGNNVIISDQEIDERYKSFLEAIGKDEFQKQLKEKGLSEIEYKSILKEKITIDRYIDSLIPGDSIKEDEIKEFYKTSSKPFINPEKVEVKLVQTRMENVAEEIINDMKAKKISFDDITGDYKKEGEVVVSDYGWIEPAFFSKEIANALRTLKKGEYGGPYKAREGFYLLKVRNRKAETPKTYDEAKNEIRIILLNQKRQAMVAHLIEERKKKASVKIYIN